MAKDIIIKMSTASINDAIKELQDIQADFERKLDLFVRTLVNDGVAVARTWIQSSATLERDASVLWQVNQFGDIYRAQITMDGKDALFIEFGSGIYYNPQDTPHAGKYGMGIGTYPGQTHAFQNGWWYYDEYGQSKYSHGTQATMPMYHASESIQNEAILRALQIFRS